MSGMNIPDLTPAWLRAARAAALISVALAAFLFGVLWQERRTATVRPESVTPVASTPTPHLASPKNVRAEFNPQSAMLIGANELIRYHQGAFVAIVRALHPRVPVVGLIDDDDDLDLGRELLREAELPEDAVHFVQHPLDSMWLRDYGPIFTRWTDGRVRVLDAAYDNPDDFGPRRRDDAFPAFLGRILNLETHRLPLVVEGGNLMMNGDGLVVTTTRVIQRPENRRYHIDDIGRLLQTHLGSRLWVYVRELEGEPTGHIDYFMTFLRRNLAVVGAIDPADDPVNAAILDEAAAILEAQITSMGAIRVERIPMPPRTADGDWRSYCNILMANGVLLMPSYADVDPALEAQALALYQRLMPSWTVVPIPADSLVAKRGLLHCVGIGIPGYVNVAPLLGLAADF